MEHSLLYRATQLKEIGEMAGAEENAKLWRTICDCTQTLVNAVGELECSTEVFRNLLDIVISEASIGKIPAFLDSVTVGDADMLRLSDKKHIYLIGVNKGEFPMSISDNSYFTEREKAALRCAFPQQSLRPEYPEGIAIRYAPQEHALAQVYGRFAGSPYDFIVGVYGEEWYIVLGEDGSAGYAPVSAFYDGNG